jgi:hypothetical protein
MTKNMFNEEIVLEARRKASYLVPYIIIFIILAVIAVLIWITTPFPALIPALQTILPLWLLSPVLLTKILVSAVAGVLALLVLIAGMIKLNRPRLFLTSERLCIMSGEKFYKEVRLDKIEAIFVKRATIIILAGGKKIIRFGPVNDPYAVRNAVVGQITVESKPQAEESIVFDKAVPIADENKKEEDVFDADVI